MQGLELVLDGGCGTGLVTKELSGSAKRVVGIDINKDMLVKAHKRLDGLENVEIYNADACNLPFADSHFDGYVSNNVLHFIEDSQKFFSEAARVLKSGGILSIASARKSCDMEIMLKSMYDYFASIGRNEELVAQLDGIAKANRALVGNIRKSSLFEPKDAAGILVSDYGFSEILEQGTVYGGQSFYVRARK
jgi:ubiquinone/menaquinone biosynthesis C-methylase UbiE